MAGENNPNFPGDEGPGSTVVAVPRLGSLKPLGMPPQPAPLPVDDAGGTMVGVGRVPIGPANFAAMNQPQPPPQVPEAGGTMVGVARFGAFAPPPPQMQTPEAGGTMVGVGRVAMPQARPFGAPVAQQPAPDAGGTMVGMARPNLGAGLLGPNFGKMAMPVAQQPAPDAGGTMVGVARFGTPPPSPLTGAPDPGGTMVGMGRIGAPNQGFAAPHAEPDPGGTMVGMGRIGAPLAHGFAVPPASDGGGTMVGIPIGGGFAPAASFAAPARPVGPPPAYEILAHLGGGDLGEVYHARHKETGAEVALRVFRPEIVAVPGATDALRDVVALAASAQHTHLGKMYELDETSTPTLVLEYVAGRQLAAILQERGAAPGAAVIDLGVRLCSALAAAHGAGLAHGRVHAGNVVLEAKTGRWVLLDLGHSYAIQALETSHDLYALGAMLYEMASGHSPFEASETAPDPRSYQPKLPASLSALLLRTLSPNPAVWFGSAIELAQALARAKSLP